MTRLLSGRQPRTELQRAAKRTLLAANELFRDLGDNVMAEVKAMTTSPPAPPPAHLRSDILQLLRDQPAVALRVIGRQSQQRQEARSRLETMAYQRLEARQARVLLEECQPRRRDG